MTQELLEQLSQAKRAYWISRIFGWVVLYLAAVLAFAILFQLLGVKVFYTFVPATLYIELLVIIKLLFKPKIVERIERKEETFDGSLKTAYDYRDKSGIIINDLLSSVASKLDKIGYSALMDFEDLTYRTLITLILAFIFITITVVSYQDLILELKLKENLFNKANQIIRDRGEKLFGGGIWESSENYSNPEEENKLGASSGGMQPGFSEGPMTGRGGGVGGEENLNIYGEPGSANLWGQEVNMELHPEYGGDVDISEEAKTLGPETYVMPDVEGAQEYKDYPVEQEELVRKYFEKVLEGSK